MAHKKYPTAEELDALHDAGEDMTPYLDFTSARRPGLEKQTVSIDLPKSMIASLDLEAERPGIDRQSMIKVWISERLEPARRKIAES